MMKRALGGIAAFVLLASAVPAWAQGAAAQCSRDDLKAVADGYVAAVEKGDSTLVPFNQWVRYSENGDDSVSMNGGLLAGPHKVDWHRTLLDPTSCQTYVEVVVTDPAHPYVVGTRMQVMGGRASEVDSVVTDQGDWLFNAANTLKYASAENWNPIAADARTDRATLLAAANAYLDYFSNKAVSVPWGKPCARLEGGLYTGKGQPTDSCDVGVPANIPITNRRAIVDDQLGAVAVFNNFGPSKRPDIHVFRVEGGKIRFIHTLTVCDKPNCGLPMPASIGGGAAAPKF